MSQVARVYVNGVEVGSLPSEQYKGIVKQAQQDWRLYVLQAFTVLASLFRFAVQVIRGTPWAIFMVLVLAVVYAPSEITATITALRQSNPGQVTEAIRTGLAFAGLLSLVSIAITSCIAPDRYGYFNRFEDAINQRLRCLLEVPAQGDVSVVVEDVNSEANV